MKTDHRNKARIKKQWSFCFLLMLFLGSCSLNQSFLYPDYHFSHKIDKLKAADPSYDVNVLLDSNYAPTFVNNKKESLTLDYVVESIWQTSESNNLLHGWAMTPKKNYNGITLLLLHGNSGNVIDNHYTIIPLIKRGFKVCLFDYSGFGLSQGKATRKNVKKDGLAALDYVLEHKDSLTKKVFIYGQSLGGHLTPVIAIQREKEIDGIIIEGAFSSHKDISQEFSGIMGRIFVAEYYNGKKAIKKFHKPVLIIHSTEDETVPYKMGETLYSQANNPKKFLEIAYCHLCGIFNYPDKIASMIMAM